MDSFLRDQMCFLYVKHLTHYLCVTVCLIHRFLSEAVSASGLCVFLTMHGEALSQKSGILVWRTYSRFVSRLRLFGILVTGCQLDCGWVGGELQLGLSGGIRPRRAALLSSWSSSDQIQDARWGEQEATGSFSCLYQVLADWAEAYWPFLTMMEISRILLRWKRQNGDRTSEHVGNSSDWWDETVHLHILIYIRIYTTDTYV